MPKTNWVLSNNPDTVYLAKESLEANGAIDWNVQQEFAVGDIVYIYEVIPPRGRGGIVYRTEVTRTNLTLATKIDDREYWIGGEYPSHITDQTPFCRLELIDSPIGGVIPYHWLTQYDFLAPQVGAHHLDYRPKLIEFIESRFVPVKPKKTTWEELAQRTATTDNEAIVYALLSIAEAVREK